MAAGGADDRRTKGLDPALSPVELVIVEEPPVSTTGGLPAPARTADNQPHPVPLGRSLGKVTGTPSFADAPTLTPGTWTDTIQPGEQLFYRMPVDWGQAPAVTFRLPSAGDKGWGSVDLAVFSPDRIPVALPLLPGTSTGSLWTYDDGTSVHAGLVPVRYRNREDYSEAIYPMSIAGDYYFSLRMSDTSGGCWQTPVEISLAVDGPVEGEPKYVDPATNTEEGSDATEHSADDGVGSESGNTGLVLTAAVVAIAGGVILMAAGFVLFRAQQPNRARNRR